ncbi:hypothetical protein BFC17_16190 [Alteromonas lipolytica]|uniref:Endonuclease/exonuclease/phosphatase domain-containing protein n=1 Tax=Alteromonas lipolytica TaxID=1856405 RepID=A0A1E8FHH7_9ALTE|nr:hypothetical protein BFC17_16190 [Alteromonas lipolytica]
MSYNIHSGVGRDGIQDYQRIGQFLASRNADFVLLQEMDTRSENRSIHDDIAAICVDGLYEMIEAPTKTTKSGWYGNAILTRHPVLHREQFDISAPGREPRTLQHVVVAVKDQQISLFNAHMGLKKAERKFQAKRIHAIMQDFLSRYPMPVCLGGDMNEWWLNTQLFKRLDKDFTQLKTGKTFPSQWPLLKLDRLWVNEALDVVLSHRIKEQAYRHYSDHIPVMVEFKTSG